MINYNVYSQDFQKINSKVRFKDFCFSEKINSAKLFKTGYPLSDPVIRLNSGETVTLTFDEVIRNNEQEEEYYYTVEHRDADWKEENLLRSDYMSGFPENDINIVRQSENTVVNYRNFILTLPNNDVRLDVSGNYIVKVFERESQKLVLIKGFSIIEPSVAIKALMIAPLNRPCMQQLDVKVEHQSLKVLDAFVNLKIRVEQNSIRIPDTKDPIPAFTQPNTTDYTRPDRNVYNGHNEYRTFDTRSLTYNGQGVANHFFNDVHKVELIRDTERSDYVATHDINGKYMIASENSTIPDIQSDYVDVIFSFTPKMPVEGRVFLFGEFTNWSISGKYEMLYMNKSYKCSVSLKQGFYNYQYVILKPNGDLDLWTTEGCFYDTENVYNIYVYYRLPEHKYDRLVGLQKISSR
jgi:hypothetical protein